MLQNLLQAIVPGYHTLGPLCYAVEQRSNILESEHVQGLLTEFAKTHSRNPNLRMWFTHMWSMVEILLDFFRADRDGNWTLLLEAFAAMLPWLTIYDHTHCARWGHVYLADIKLLEKTAPVVYAEFMQGTFVVNRTKIRFNQVSADQVTEWINKTCKVQNGIIGVTRNDQTRVT